MTNDEMIILATTHPDFDPDATPYKMALLARHQDRLNQGERGPEFAPMILFPENRIICEFPWYQVIEFSDGTRMKFDVDGQFYKPDFFSRWFGL